MHVHRRTVFLWIGLGLAFAMGFGLAARMTNPAGGAIPRNVVAGGGGRSTAPLGSILSSTIGQPATAISMAANGSMLVGGFQTMTRRPSTGVRRWKSY